MVDTEESKEAEDKSYSEQRQKIAEAAKSRKVSSIGQKGTTRTAVWRPSTAAEKTWQSKQVIQQQKQAKSEQASQEEWNKYWHIGNESLPKTDYEMVGTIESGNFTIKAKPQKYKKYSDKYSKSKGYDVYNPRVLEFKGGVLVKDASYGVDRTYNSKSRTEWGVNPTTVKEFGDSYITELGYKTGEGIGTVLWKQNILNYDGGFIQGWNDLSEFSDLRRAREVKDKQLELTSSQKELEALKKDYKIIDNKVVYTQPYTIAAKQKEIDVMQKVIARARTPQASKTNYNVEQQSAVNYAKGMGGMKVTTEGGQIRFMQDAPKANIGMKQKAAESRFGALAQVEEAGNTYNIKPKTTMTSMYGQGGKINAPIKSGNWYGNQTKPQQFNMNVKLQGNLTQLNALNNNYWTKRTNEKVKNIMSKI